MILWSIAMRRLGMLLLVLSLLQVLMVLDLSRGTLRIRGKVLLRQLTVVFHYTLLLWYNIASSKTPVLTDNTLRGGMVLPRGASSMFAHYFHSLLCFCWLRRDRLLSLVLRECFW